MNIIPHPDKISSPWTGEGKVRVKNKISSPPSVIAIPDSYRGRRGNDFPPPFEGGARGGKIVIPDGACPPWAGSGI